MGKGLVVLVMASMSALTYMGANKIELDAATEKVRTDYIEQVLSRELAHSAFNLVVSRVTKDFTGYRSEDSDRAYGDGMYAFSASGDAQGPIVITAYGKVGGALHLIQAELTRTGVPILDAMTVDGPMASVTGQGSSFVISGLDKPANETDAEGGNGADGHAIRTVLASSSTAFSEAIDADQLLGLKGPSDVASGAPNVDLAVLQSAILENENLIVLEGNQRITGNKVFGSPEAPVVMRVAGNLTVRGTVEGYGVLLVEGSFSNSGTIRWEGLVLLSSNGGDHEFKGNVDLYGALVLRSTTQEEESGGYLDAGLIGGHFDVDVFDGTGNLQYHQHQYDDRFNVTGLNFLSTNCEVDGGLCWNRNVVEKNVDRVRVSILNTGEATGTFELQTTSGLEQGDLSSDVVREVAVADLESFSIGFNSACHMSGTSPGEVWADESSRHGQLRLTVHDFSPEESGQPAILMHELVLYRHSVDSLCNVDDHGSVDVQPISFYINGNVHIHSSASALRKLEGVLPVLQVPPPEIKMTTVRQNSARKSNP